MIKEPKIKLDDILTLDDMNFNQGNVCIVTGIGTGIGRATALAAAINNLDVVGLDINADEALKTVGMANGFGKTVTFIKTDLGNDSDIESAVKKASRLGDIAFVANIAGLQHVDPLDEFPMEKYDLMHRVMLRAPLYLSKLVMPYMKRKDYGVIGNMASIHSHICTGYKVAYNILKAGILGLTRSISAEGDGKIRSFSVSTGYVATPLALKQIPSQAKQRGITEEEVIRDVMMGKSRVKEMMTPIEVANAFIYGFSKHGKYLVGNDLLLDGGTINTYWINSGKKLLS